MARSPAPIPVGVPITITAVVIEVVTVPIVVTVVTVVIAIAIAAVTETENIRDSHVLPSLSTLWPRITSPGPPPNRWRGYVEIGTGPALTDPVRTPAPGAVTQLDIW